MRVIGLKILKNKLSEYVRLATGGETVLVTDRDRVVAEIVPPHPSRERRVSDALLAELVRKGVVSPPMAHTGKPPPRGTPVAPLATLLAELREDRDGR